MSEKDLKGKLADLLRQRGWVVFKHEDRYTPGVPDMSATSRGRTAWLEAKEIEAGPEWATVTSPMYLARINFQPLFGTHKSGHFRMQQLMTLKKLAEAGAWMAIYVLLLAGANGMYVAMVDPRVVLESKKQGMPVKVLFHKAEDWASWLTHEPLKRES